MHLQRVHRPDEKWQPQIIRLIEQKTQQGEFVSPSINPEPYREFHYYHDEHNILWALLVMEAKTTSLMSICILNGMLTQKCLHCACSTHR